MEQLDLWSYLGFYSDGDEVPFECLGNVVTFEWLTKHIGCQVALRYVTESMKYYVAATVVKLTEGTYFKGCRRIILRAGKNHFPLLDEPEFFLQHQHTIYLVYEL